MAVLYCKPNDAKPGIQQANMAAQSVRDDLEDKDNGKKDSKKSPEDTYGSTKSLNSDDENSPPIPDITHGEETQPFVSNPTDSNPSPGASNEGMTTQSATSQSSNTERKPKTWCCVLVGTKCKQILEDVPLLLANGSQLRAVFELDEKTRYHIHLLTLSLGFE
ncbi:hypothetical protein AM593_04812, partial [Mytilus galloprovincialis]